jgi:tetratricopeptide (TPR) repeat protein
LTDHLTRDDLYHLVKGTLSRRRGQQALQHLLRSCPACSHALAEYGGFTLDAIPEDAYDDVVTRVTTEVSQTAAARHEALALLDALLTGRRAWQELSPADFASLRGLPRLAALLDTGWSLRHRDPQATLRFARLARYAADRLDAKQLGPDVVADLRCLAWAELGNAYRILCDFPRASRSMNRAIYWSTRGSSSTLLLVRVADLLGSLFFHQRRFDDAKALFRMVYDAHRAEGRDHLAGRTLISWAALEPPASSIPMVHRALDLIDAEREPQLMSQALQGMITALNELGHHRAARRLLWRCRAVVAEHVDPPRLRWLEGKIYAGVGDLERAEKALIECRQEFAEREQVYPAAMTGLDLAAVWVRQGRADEVYRLAQEMIATFRALRIAREAVVTLVILQRACLSGGGQLLEIIDMVGSFLKELEQQPTQRQQQPTAPAD